MATHADTLREAERLEALARYDILDTPREESFDRITRLVRRVFDVPIATVTFLDAHRQWFKSSLGLSSPETERPPSLCDHAIRSDVPLVVPDTLQDPRFATSKLVVGQSGIRFYAGVPLRTPDGHAIGTLCASDTKPRAFCPEDVATLQDLARLTMDELELRQLATTDSLTGALTRRGFREAAGRAVGLGLRHGHELSCIAFDLDRFKAVNDAHGHPAGDQVLVGTIEACRAKLRTTDIVGRLGGEEFAVVLPHTGLAAALDVAEKLRATVAAQRFEAAGRPFGVTASFGIAELERTAPSLDTLMEHADKVLYAAKAMGRDRCVAWEQPDPKAGPVRRRVLKAGRISFNGKRSSIDCTVRSLSDKDARLEVFTSAGLPARFELMIESDKFVRGCHVTGQSDKHLDVAFD